MRFSEPRAESTVESSIHRVRGRSGSVYVWQGIGITIPPEAPRLKIALRMRISLPQTNGLQLPLYFRVTQER
jgi:hypothetical protein